jgi:anthranilate synthase/aminodeoxychorismate synthase-like glutamine amidotransferase
MRNAEWGMGNEIVTRSLKTESLKTENWTLKTENFPMILVIDNYDSFVHNLARYFRQLGCETRVVRNDAITLEEIAELKPSAIVISPGPCAPNEAGVSLTVIQTFADSIPILGVCLGHQAIVQGFGGRVEQSHQPMHGRESSVFHFGSAMFRDIPSPFVAGRYHSLIAEKTNLPNCLTVTARTDDHTIMAVEHNSLPIVGLQFHPESILTEKGYQLILNFLAIAEIPLPPVDPISIQSFIQHCCESP